MFIKNILRLLNETQDIKILIQEWTKKSLKYNCFKNSRYSKDREQWTILLSGYHHVIEFQTHAIK